MKKVVRKLLSISCISVLLLSSSVYANKDDVNMINTTLEQPSVYSAAPGDTLNYTQRIELPKDYEKKYKSFAVTVRMDPGLDIQKAELKGYKLQKDKLTIDINKSDKADQNTVTLCVNDLALLNKKTKLDLEIETKVKKGMKGDDLFTNSFILSYTTIDGHEQVENQKNLTSNTKKANGVLKVTNQVYDNTKEIKGQTEKNSVVKVLLGDKVIAEGKSDANGNYKIQIQPLEKGTHLKVVSYNNNEKIADEEVIVEKFVETASIIEDEEKEKQKAEKYNISSLRDYLAMAENLNVKNADKEDSARLKAAVANGDYIRVKSKPTTEDFEDAVVKLESASKEIRKPYMNGYDEYNFGPEDAMTRAQASAVVARVINKEDPKGDYSSFKDVKQDKWYSEAIAFMEKEEIIKGYEDNTFKPEKNITRAEFASIIAKLVDEDKKDKEEKEYSAKEFKDVKSDFWAYDDISTVVSLKIMNGRDNNTFAPNEPIKRAEVATVLNKLLGREANKEFMKKYSKNPYKDLKENHWAYYEILEITGN